MVRTALDLLGDTSGTPLTMQLVADALNTKPMSLYTHVENRDDLVAATARLAFSEWVAERDVNADWEDQLRTWSHSLRAFTLKYPQLIEEFTKGGRTEPAFLRNVVVLIQILRDAGLDNSAIAEAIRWIPQTVLGAIVLEVSRPNDLQSADDEAAMIYASLSEATPEERRELLQILPHLGHQSLDNLFSYSVDRLIDGVRQCTTEAEQ